MLKKYFLYIVLFFSFFAFGKKFATDYVSFDLLNNWYCYPESHDWICVNKLQPKKASEAMIILVAKQKGPMDSLDQYIKHLKQVRQIKGVRGKQQVKSKIYHTKQRQINNHQWIDSQHESSEVPDYFTRYVVTLKGQTAVLVTYSVHKKHYKEYAADFARSIDSLRVKDVAGSLGAGGRGRSGQLGVGTAQGYMQGLIDAEGELGAGQFGDSASGDDLLSSILSLLKTPKGIVGLLVLVALGGGLFILKRKKKRRRGSSRSSGDGGDRGSRYRRASRRSSSHRIDRNRRGSRHR